MEIIEILNREDVELKLNNTILQNSFNIYCRVSTESQIDNTSLNSQKDYGIKYVNHNHPKKFKYCIVWKEGGKSGDDLSEDVGSVVRRELLSIIMNYWEKQTISNIWVFDLSRLSRNSDSSMVIKSRIYKYGIDLFVENQKYNFDSKMDKLIFNILSSINEFENTQRFEKMLDGKLRILSDNKWWGGTIPIGYKLDDNNRLVENEKTSKFVKMMFKYYSEGKSIQYIKLLLERIGLQTQRGNTIWNTSSILKILGNKIYIGELDYEVKGIKGKSKEYCRKRGMVTELTIKTQPIIDKKLFLKVKDKIEYNRKNRRKPPKYNYLLNGLLECGCCGKPLSGRVNKKNNINVYSCNTNINSKRINNISLCNNFKSINIDITELLIWEKIIKVWENSELIRRKFREDNIPKNLTNSDIKKQIRNLNEKINRRNSTIVDMNNRMDDVLEDYILKKGMSKERIDSISKKLEEKISSVKEEINELESKKTYLERGDYWEEWLESFKNYTSKIKSLTTFSEKKDFLNSVIEKIVVYWDEITKTHKLKIHFHLRIVKDRGEDLGNYIFDLKSGRKVCELKNIKYRKLINLQSKNGVLQTSFINHSTVTESSINEVKIPKVFKTNTLKEVDSINLILRISITTSKLTKFSHYNSYQIKLFKIIEKLKDDYGFGYRKISKFLIENNFKTVRSNKPILQNYVYSIYKKGKIRKQRIEREFETIIDDVILYKD